MRAQSRHPGKEHGAAQGDRASSSSLVHMPPKAHNGFQGRGCEDGRKRNTKVAIFYSLVTSFRYRRTLAG